MDGTDRGWLSSYGGQGCSRRTGIGHRNKQQDGAHGKEEAGSSTRARGNRARSARRPRSNTRGPRGRQRHTPASTTTSTDRASQGTRPANITLPDSRGPLKARLAATASTTTAANRIPCSISTTHHQTRSHSRPTSSRRTSPLKTCSAPPGTPTRTAELYDPGPEPGRPQHRRATPGPGPLAGRLHGAIATRVAFSRRLRLHAARPPGTGALQIPPGRRRLRVRDVAHAVRAPRAGRIQDELRDGLRALADDLENRRVVAVPAHRETRRDLGEHRVRPAGPRRRAGPASRGHAGCHADRDPSPALPRRRWTRVDPRRRPPRSARRHRTAEPSPRCARQRDRGPGRSRGPPAERPRPPHGEPSRA